MPLLMMTAVFEFHVSLQANLDESFGKSSCQSDLIFLSALTASSPYFSVNHMSNLPRIADMCSPPRENKWQLPNRSHEADRCSFVSMQ
ncbi:hypothetical protein TNCV_3011441 [Trichonephila clavipes]|nr:hypothetical protein TNCV_3011441 [Trichonephila clavipes]